MLKSQCSRWFQISSSWQLKLTIIAYLYGFLFISLQYRLQFSSYITSLCLGTLYCKQWNLVQKHLFFTVMFDFHMLHWGGFSSWNHNYSWLFYENIMLSSKTGFQSCLMLAQIVWFKVSPPNWECFLKGCLSIRQGQEVYMDTALNKWECPGHPRSEVNERVCYSLLTTGTILQQLC